MRCRCSMGFGRSLLSRALACVRARVRGFVSAVVSIVKCCPVYVALRGKNGMGVAFWQSGGDTASGAGRVGRLVPGQPLPSSARAIQAALTK
jgi:hypothetical protein